MRKADEEGGIGTGPPIILHPSQRKFAEAIGMENVIYSGELPNNVLDFPAAVAEQHQVQGRLLIYRCIDPDNDEWIPVLPFNVPPALLDPEEMGRMVMGFLAKPPGSEHWYRAEEVSDAGSSTESK